MQDVDVATLLEFGHREVDADPGAIRKDREQIVRLARKSVEDLLTQVPDLTGLFGDPDELPGRNQSAVDGPPNERLHPPDAQVVRPDDRLVVQDELAPPQPLGKSLPEICALLGLLVHALGVVGEPVTTGLLGRIHRRVGGVEHTLDRVRVVWDQCHPDARSDPHDPDVGLGGF